MQQNVWLRFGLIFRDYTYNHFLIGLKGIKRPKNKQFKPWVYDFSIRWYVHVIVWQDSIIKSLDIIAFGDVYCEEIMEQKEEKTTLFLVCNLIKSVWFLPNYGNLFHTIYEMFGGLKSHGLYRIRVKHQEGQGTSFLQLSGLLFLTRKARWLLWF